MGKNIPYYIIAAGIFIFLKIGYTFSDNNDLYFLLKPSDKLIEFATNSDSQYATESGYFHQKLNIVIDKSCSGFNFWVLCFVMLAFLSLQFLKKRSFKMLVIPSALLVSYFLTLFVNSSRILFSIFVHKNGDNFIGDSPSWMHQAEGTFIYLSFLIVIYLGFNFILKKLTLNHAKIT